MVSPRRVNVEHFEVDGTRWETAVRPLPKLLVPGVRQCAGYGETRAGPVARHEMPGPFVVIIMELGPPIRVHDATHPARATRFNGGFVAGLDDHSTLTTHEGMQRGIQLSLSPTAARRFFNVPMSELRGQVVSLRDLLCRQHASLSEQLTELMHWDARLDVVEALVARRITASAARTELATWATSRIEAEPGIDLKTLARELGYSMKHVIALFHEHVGMTPKQFARIVRFDRLVRHLRSGGGGSWAEIAQRLGWYDQAHLSGDVKRILGVSPERARTMLAGAPNFEVNSFQDGRGQGGLPSST